MNRTLIIIAFGVVGIIVSIFGSWPRYQDYATERTVAEFREQELSSREAYFIGLSETNDRLGQYEGEIAKVFAAIPEDTLLPALYQSMQQLSASSGLVMGSVSVIEGTTIINDIQAKPIEISINLNGSYEAFKVFLANAEVFPRILEVQSVNFASVEVGNDFSFNVRLRAFAY